MTELDTKRWLVLDAQANKRLWGKLAPGAAFVSAETLQMRQAKLSLDWKTEQGTDLPEHPQIIVIHADCHVIAAPASTVTGTEWAMRLREEANRFHCPILLVSFQGPEYAEIRELQDHGTELLRSFLKENWQARWSRLPLTDMNLQVLAREAIGVLEAKNPGETEWRDLARGLCKGQIERVHRQYKHGRGSFTTAIWLLSGAVQNGAITLADALGTIDAIEQKHMKADEGDYNFSRFRRHLHLLSAQSGCIRFTRRGQRKLLLIEDEYGWEEALRALLPRNWIVTPVSDDQIAECAFGDYDLIFLDENLGDGRRSGLDLILDIRAQEPLVPVILFTSNRDPAVSIEALHRGATDVLLKQSSDTDERDAVASYRDFHDLIEDYGRTNRNVVQPLSRVWKQVRDLQVSAHLPQNKQKHVEIALGQLRQVLILGALANGVIGAGRYDPRSTCKAAFVLLNCAARNAAWSLGAKHGGKTDELFTSIKERNPVKFRNHAAVDHGERDIIPTVEQVPNLCDSLRVWLLKKCLVTAATVVRHAHLLSKMPRTTIISQSSHETRSRDGARRFLTGFLLSERKIDAQQCTTLTDDQIKVACSALSATKAYAANELLLVDDAADYDGWLYALQVALCRFGWRVTHLARSKSELETAMQKADFSNATLLLDLRLPSAKGEKPDEGVGEECIAKLREADANVPIVIFSATTSGFRARRCLRPQPPNHSRAQGYFVKSASALPTDGATGPGEFYSRYFEEFLELLNISAPIMKRGGTAQLNGALSRCLKDCRSDDELNRKIASGCSVSMKESPHDTLQSYLQPEIQSVLQLAWAAEDPQCEFLAQRLFGVGGSSPDGARAALYVAPAGLLEQMVRLLFAIACDDWVDRNLTAAECITLLRQNRQYFKTLDTDEFDEAWLPIFIARNTVKHHASVPIYPIVKDFCNALTLICQQLDETAKERASGNGPHLGQFGRCGSTGDWASFGSNSVVRGTVLGRVGRGFQVDVGGVLAFWPNGHSDYPNLATAQLQRGRTFDFTVVEADPSANPPKAVIQKGSPRPAPRGTGRR